MVLARHGTPVRLWGYRGDSVAAIATTRCNEAHLPGFTLSEGIEPTSDLRRAVDGVAAVLIAVPSEAFTPLLDQLRDHLQPGLPLVWATKGLGPDGLLGTSVVQALPAHPRAVLSGPSFAAEVAAALPTAITLAAEDSVTETTLTGLLRGPRFRVYTTRDLVGVQLGGAVKNVIAIATGISDGLGLGANARSALITRGLAEIRRLGQAMGAEDETFSGLAGMGDLVLTCSDDQSRNRSYGLALGRGNSGGSGTRTIEGSGTAERVVALATSYGVELPICTQVAAVIEGRRTPAEATEALMQRGLSRD
jgi:glycerol-3-phosphate dehydrogenase (NAD(P)+)